MEVIIVNILGNCYDSLPSLNIILIKYVVLAQKLIYLSIATLARNFFSNSNISFFLSFILLAGIPT